MSHFIKVSRGGCREDMDFINKMVDKSALERLRHVAETPFKRITYTEAVEILEGVVRDGKKKFEFPVIILASLRVPS